MNRWEKVCSAAGLKVGFIAKVIGESEGAERTALSALLNKASGLAAEDRIDEAVEHLKLAAAMVEQRGRVLGALRAAKAIEVALSNEDPLDYGEVVLSEIKRAMVGNGFGSQTGGVS